MVVEHLDIHIQTNKPTNKQTKHGPHILHVYKNQLQIDHRPKCKT